MEERQTNERHRVSMHQASRHQETDRVVNEGAGGSLMSKQARKRYTSAVRISLRHSKSSERHHQVITHQASVHRDADRMVSEGAGGSLMSKQTRKRYTPVIEKL